MRDDQFDRLYAEHAGPLLGFLTYRTGNRVLAEDLLSDTFERALSARARFDPRRGREKTWLYAIALNLLRDHTRRESTEQRIMSQVGQEQAVAGPGGLEGVEEHDAVVRALDVLTTDEREAIALRYGADLTAREIARVTRDSHPAVEKRLTRGLTKLRGALE